MAVEAGQFDRKSAERIGEATRYVETMRRGSPNGRPNRPIRTGFYFVKPDQDVTAGRLTAPDNVFSIWKGPAHETDEDTGRDINGGYATQDFTTADYCVATWQGGFWYISCFQPAGTGSV